MTRLLRFSCLVGWGRLIRLHRITWGFLPKVHSGEWRFSIGFSFQNEWSIIYPFLQGLGIPQTITKMMLTFISQGSHGGHSLNSQRLMATRNPKANHRLDVKQLVNNGINYNINWWLQDFWTINSISNQSNQKPQCCSVFGYHRSSGCFANGCPLEKNFGIYGMSLLSARGHCITNPNNTPLRGYPSNLPYICFKIQVWSPPTKLVI